jgi:hypothetical protein
MLPSSKFLLVHSIYMFVVKLAIGCLHFFAFAVYGVRAKRGINNSTEHVIFV